MEGISNKLVMVILILVVLIISFGLLYQYMNKTSDKSINEKCRLSVATYSKLFLRGFPVKTDQIHCPVKDITLKGEDSDKRVLAEEMKTCWENFGKGELTLFEGNGLFCSVCSRISAKEEVKIDNFEQYLQNNVVKGKDYTYINYLSNFRYVDDGVADLRNYNPKVINQFPDSTITISDDDKYGVLFIYARGEHAKKYLAAIGDNLATGASMVGVGILVSGVGAASTFIPIVGTVTGPVLMFGGSLITLSGYFYTFVSSFFSKSQEVYSEVVLRPYTNETLLKDLGCTYIPTSLIDE
ncbi:hypothetical protein KY334_03745 [Candidatus Woesearchaeota archaeon]|nr:hypothetical protein [Candidatus Woesearchaeota archaeon]